MRHEDFTLLDARLRELPHPAPPPDLTGIVLARIAQLDAGAKAAAKPRVARGKFRDQFAWIAAIAGLVAGIALVIGSPAANPADDFSIGWMRAMTPSLLAVPSLTLASVVLAGGLLLFVAGLQVSVGKDRSSRGSA